VTLSLGLIDCCDVLLTLEPIASEERPCEGRLTRRHLPERVQLREQLAHQDRRACP
jgi:hypothetical protein